MTLVGGFTQRGAGAVIGTEITIFASLAYTFANAFLDAFIGNPSRIGLGSALRAARLELLRRWNPLGLVYVLYGPADAQLRD
jgi:hypothetical protein